MKKAFSFIRPTGLLTVFLLILFSCESTPAPQELVKTEAEAVPSDIWSLLRAGDPGVKDYFQGEVYVNSTDSQGRTPLHYAAERGDAQLASFFISLGADTNALDFAGQSPLGISVDNSEPSVTRVLAASGADIHLPIRNSSAASIALGKDPAVFRALLTPSTIESVDRSGKSVIHLASINGNTQGVKDIISLMPSSASIVNQRDSLEKNALDYALERPDSRNHMEIAEQLILSGGYSDNRIFQFFAPSVRSANYNIRRNEGLAPIHYAVMENHTGLITFLLEKNIDVNIQSISGASALHEAVRNGNMDVIRTLVNKGADVNARDARGNTPLHTGVPLEVHREIVTYLLQNGADPNLRDEHGETPLHIAIILNRPAEVIQAILNGSTEVVHIRNIEGKTPLYIAVQESRLSIIPLLLSYDSEVFAADNTGRTPFDIASQSVEKFNQLITHDTVNQRDADGNSMLHVAVRNHVNARQIALILDHRASVDARNKDGETALHFAVRSNQRESGEFLISRGADIFALNAAGQSPLFIALTSTPMREWIINPNTVIARDGLGNNILHYAAEWNLDNSIPVIVRNGININEVNATGQTPLFLALRNDSPSTIRTLLGNNANINARDSQGNSVLHEAVRWNALNSAEFLISSGIDINPHCLNGNTPLHDAVIHGMGDMETLLLTNRANLEARNTDGNTPFMEAARAGNISSIEKLAVYRADPSTRNIRGDTPLHIAVSTGDLELVNILLRMGASIHARNTRNRTPFQTSLTVSPRMASTLLNGERINSPDDMGNSPLHIALQERASSEIIRTIISQGARINSVDSNGKTPLRIAVDLESWAAAKLIADSGADPFIVAVDSRTPAEVSFIKGEDGIRALFSGRAINARDNSGNTVLHLAARYGNPAAINTLIELGGNRTLRNISLELPYDIALRWNRRDNAELLR